MTKIPGLPQRGLAHSIKRTVGVGGVPEVWWGLVTAVNSGPPPTLTVNYNGTGNSISVAVGDTYWRLGPAVGDRVWGLSDREGDNWAVDRISKGVAAPLKPVFSGYGSAAQAVPANGAVIQINTVVVDTRSGFNAGTYAYTIPEAGVYRVSAQAKNTTQQIMEAQIYHNGSAAKNGTYINVAGDMGCVVTALLDCAAGDTITFFLWAAVALTTQIDSGGGQDSYLDIEKVYP